MRAIQLTRGYVALVDDEDYALVASYSWSALPRRHTVYAQTSTRGLYSQTAILMHRLILGAKHGEQVDHVNGDGSDNRRANLRFATQRQNTQNQTRKAAGTSSKYKGVNWEARRSKWLAQIRGGPLCADGSAKKLHLGYFLSERDAALAYDRAARRHFGEFAGLNFPEDQ